MLLYPVDNGDKLVQIEFDQTNMVSEVWGEI